MAYLNDQFAAASEVSEEELRSALQRLEADVAMSTPKSYSANGELHPDHLQSFTEKHMLYLKQHPKVNAEQYLSNLRLMIRIR